MFDSSSKSKALSSLGLFLENYLAENISESEQHLAEELGATLRRSELENPWFTQDNLRFALQSWADTFKSNSLENWLSAYSFAERRKVKKVGIVAAGNVPLVAWHDIMCVWISGNEAVVKLSTKDRLLIPFFVKYLAQICQDIENEVQFVERLESVDAAICTGSNNTSRYFEYYFRNIPNIIRRNRTSVAVLTGEETEEELRALGQDIFRYFGLGCRNVTKLYMPESFDINRVFGAIFQYKEVVNHNKYANNYDYHRAILLMNLDEVLDNGFMVFKESNGLHSPVGTMFYERYKDLPALLATLENQKEDLQCVVGKRDRIRNAVPFGQAQCPALDDYADGIDTLEFLLKL